MKDDPVIWLAPHCEDIDDREWCSENLWPEGCEECGAMPVKYVLAPDQPQPPPREEKEEEEC